MTDYIPDNLAIVNPQINNESHLNAVQTFYNLLFVNDYEANRFRVETTFLGQTDQQFQAIKNQYPTFEKNPFSLFKLCQFVINAPAPTRAHQDALVALFDDPVLNQKLITWCAQRGDQGNAEPTLLESVTNYAHKISAMAGYLTKKTIKAKKFYKLSEQWMRETGILQTQVSQMLLGLTPRSDIFATAQRIVNTREQSIAAYRDYLQYKLENLDVGILVLRGIQYRQNVHFVYNDFKASVQNKRVFLGHHYIIGEQVTDILTDPTIQPVSTNLDSLISKIHTFQPDVSELNNKKAQRLNDRITALDTDYEEFKNSPNKTPSKAKLLKTSCQFLLNELESLYLQGPQDHITSIPEARSAMETRVAYIDTYLTSIENTKEQEVLENKAASSEISKSLSIVNLPALKSPLGYLNWRANLERLFKHYKSDLSRMSLIRKSVVRKQDRYRLDTMKTHTEMLNYIQKIYGQLDYLLPLMFKKLSTLPPGNNDFQVLRNYEIFIQNVSLLKDNNLLDRLDRFLIETLVTKVLTETARSLYYRDMLLKEPDWREEADLATQDNAVINTNQTYEQKRRDHFLEFAADSYETLRRITNNKFFDNQMKFSQNQRDRRDRTGNFSTTAQGERQHNCPFCNTHHPPTLLKCPNFNKWTPQIRLEKMKGVKGYCRRCLDKVDDFSKHKLRNNLCPNQEKTGTCRKCKFQNHHTYLHLTREGQSEPKQGQFKRGNRQARYSNSTKVNFTGVETDDAVVTEDILEDDFLEELDSIQVNCTFPQVTSTSHLYLTCATISNLEGPWGTNKAITLLDSASVLNFGTNSFLQGLGYKPIRFWSGELKTLTHSDDVNLPVYLVDFRLANNQVVKILVLGIDKPNLGQKTKIDHSVYSQIVKDSNMNQTDFHNISGDIHILLGLRSARLLGISKAMPNNFKRKYPDIKVISTPLSRYHVLAGHLKVPGGTRTPIQSNVISVFHSSLTSHEN